MFHYRSPDRIIYDEEYRDRLIRENYADIYAYCFRHLGHRETAEDLTQETFLRFLRNVERYREYGKIKNYLYVIAGNVIRDHYRKPRGAPCGEGDLRRKKESPCRTSDVEHAAERVEIREALAALESPDREIVHPAVLSGAEDQRYCSRDGHAGVHGALPAENGRKGAEAQA